MHTHTHQGSGMDEWRRGWGIVLAAALGVAIGGLHFHFIGTMIRPLQDAYGWGRAEIAYGLTIISLINPVTNLLSGLLVDRYGSRRVALVGIFLFALGYGLMAMAGPKLWGWWLACGLFAVLSMGISGVVWTGLVVRRFVVQRGTALAMSLIGGGIMVAVTPMLVVRLLEHMSVRGVFFTVGGVGALLMLTTTALFFREEAPDATQPTRANGATATAHLPGLALKEALRSPVFWKLSAALALVAATVGPFAVHIQPMLTDSGLDAMSAATVAFFIGPSMIVGRLGTGVLFDHFSTRQIAALAFCFPIVACFLLMTLNGSYLHAVAAGIFVGLGMGAEVDALAYLTSRYFGLRSYGVLFALMLGIYTIGSGSGTALAGMAFDKFHNYDSVLMLFAGGCTLAVLLALNLGKPPQWNAPHAPAAGAGGH